VKRFLKQLGKPRKRAREVEVGKGRPAVDQDRRPEEKERPGEERHSVGPEGGRARAEIRTSYIDADQASEDGAIRHGESVAAPVSATEGQGEDDGQSTRTSDWSATPSRMTSTSSKWSSRTGLDPHKIDDVYWFMIHLFNLTRTIRTGKHELEGLFETKSVVGLPKCLDYITLELELFSASIEDAVLSIRDAQGWFELQDTFAEWGRWADRSVGVEDSDIMCAFELCQDLTLEELSGVSIRRLDWPEKR
jgi:hypothetical protein